MGALAGICGSDMGEMDTIHYRIRLTKRERHIFEIGNPVRNRSDFPTDEDDAGQIDCTALSRELAWHSAAVLGGVAFVCGCSNGCRRILIGWVLHFRITAVRAVRREDRSLQGVLGADFELGRFEAFLDDFEIETIGAAFLLLDGGGAVLRFSIVRMNMSPSFRKRWKVVIGISLILPWKKL